MPSRLRTPTPSISPSAHPLANSSGKEAPARKLNAEPACNSIYISRTSLSETTPAAANRNKSGTAHTHPQDLQSGYFFVYSLKNEFPRPIPLDPKDPATSLQKFATARTPPPFPRARRKKISAPADLRAIPRGRERWGAKDENRLQALSFETQKIFFPLIYPPLQAAFFCDRLPLPAPTGSAQFESHPAGAYPSVAASPHSRRPPVSRAAPWSTPVFPAPAKQAEIIRVAWCAPGPLPPIALFL